MKNAYNLTPTQRRQVVSVATVALLLLGALAAARITALAGSSIPADDPRWEQVVMARMTTFRVLVGLVLAALVPLGAWLAFGLLDRTGVGPRMLHWREGDPALVKAAKKLNGGLVLGSLLLGLYWLAAACLR